MTRKSSITREEAIKRLAEQTNLTEDEAARILDVFLRLVIGRESPVRRRRDIRIIDFDEEKGLFVIPKDLDLSPLFA